MAYLINLNPMVHLKTVQFRLTIPMKIKKNLSRSNLNLAQETKHKVFWF